MHLLHNKFITNLELILLIQLEAIIGHAAGDQFCIDFIDNFRKENEKDDDLIFAKLSAKKIYMYARDEMGEVADRWSFIKKIKMKKPKMVSKEADQVIEKAFAAFVDDLFKDHRYQFNGISAAGLYHQTEAVLVDANLYDADNTAKVREMLDWLLEYYVQAGILKIVDGKYLHVDARPEAPITRDMVYECFSSLLFKPGSGEYSREEIQRHCASRCMEFGASQADIQFWEKEITGWIDQKFLDVKLFTEKRGDVNVYFNGEHAKKIGYIDSKSSNMAVIETISENIVHYLKRMKIRLSADVLQERTSTPELSQFFPVHVNGCDVGESELFSLAITRMVANKKINVRLEESTSIYTYGLPEIDYSVKPKLEDPVKFTLKTIEERLSGQHWLTAYQITSQVLNKLVEAGSEQTPLAIEVEIEFVLEILVAQGKIEKSKSAPLMYRLAEKTINPTEVLIDQLSEKYLLTLIESIVKRYENPLKLDALRNLFVDVLTKDHPHVKPSLVLQGAFVTMVHRAMKAGLIVAVDGTAQEFKAPAAKTS